MRMLPRKELHPIRWRALPGSCFANHTPNENPRGSHPEGGPCDLVEPIRHSNLRQIRLSQFWRVVPTEAACLRGVVVECVEEQPSAQHKQPSNPVFGDYPHGGGRGGSVECLSPPNGRRSTKSRSVVNFSANEERRRPPARERALMRLGQLPKTMEIGRRAGVLFSGGLLWLCRWIQVGNDSRKAPFRNPRVSAHDEVGSANGQAGITKWRTSTELHHVASQSRPCGLSMR